MSYEVCRFSVKDLLYVREEYPIVLYDRPFENPTKTIPNILNLTAKVSVSDPIIVLERIYTHKAYVDRRTTCNHKILTQEGYIGYVLLDVEAFSFIPWT
jgi:hypothetical protein